jgi:hypothetical protein
MRPTTLMRLFTACLMVLGASFIFRGVLVQSSTPQIYDPYPPGILPPDLNAEIARVLREIDVIEARALARWRALTPPS